MRSAGATPANFKARVGGTLLRNAADYQRISKRITARFKAQKCPSQHPRHMSPRLAILLFSRLSELDKEGRPRV
jgi:hypothetical protein